MEHKALIIEDERDIAALVALHLRDLGLDAHMCTDGATGLQRALHETWSIIVLDLSLPQMDGIEVCHRLRDGGIFAPLLMLTARGSEHERAHGLNVGADDYLAKPFGVVELIARVKALLRRAQGFVESKSGTARKLRAGAIELDLERRIALRSGTPLVLTAREFDLLAHFAVHPGRVFSRAQLLDQVWGSTHDAYEHAVSSHINRLRAKLEPNPQAPRYLITVWGVGYRLAHGAAEAR
jgi:two-component system, OmpR family, response regulator